MLRVSGVSRVLGVSLFQVLHVRSIMEKKETKLLDFVLEVAEAHIDFCFSLIFFLRVGERVVDHVDEG